MSRIKVNTFGKLVAALGTKDFKPKGFVSKALDEHSIKGLSREQIVEVSNTVKGALLRSDAWIQNDDLSHEIIEKGKKFVDAEELLTRAEEIGIDTSSVDRRRI